MILGQGSSAFGMTGGGELRGNGGGELLNRGHARKDVSGTDNLFS